MKTIPIGAQAIAEAFELHVGDRVRIREGCACAGHVLRVAAIIGTADATDPACIQIYDVAGVVGPVRLTELEPAS